jgi:hypothetical protein
MNFRQMRRRSMEIAEALGYRTLEHLPLREEVTFQRTVAEVTDRYLALLLVVDVSYGLDRAPASAWLDRESLWESLTDREKKFVVESEGEPHRVQWLIEAAWALAWALGLVKTLDFTEYCSRDFYKLWPDFKAGESSASIRKQCRLRSQDELLKVCDLAYCLHWSIVEERINGRDDPGKMPGELVTQRRRAIEWIMDEEIWDEVFMDT